MTGVYKYKGEGRVTRDHSKRRFRYNAVKNSGNREKHSLWNPAEFRLLKLILNFNECI